MTTVSFHLDKELEQKLCRLALHTDRSKSYIMRKALESFFESHPLPNSQTRKVIDDARAGKDLIKVENFSQFLDTL